ncbi:hypothetical protein FRC04_001999 [Tulasnella sp. 424]|nr:hypothetical protein FRC04_001999 [Tulasnella sp. 424]
MDTASTCSPQDASYRYFEILVFAVTATPPGTHQSEQIAQHMQQSTKPQDAAKLFDSPSPNETQATEDTAGQDRNSDSVDDKAGYFRAAHMWLACFVQQTKLATARPDPQATAFHKSRVVLKFDPPWPHYQQTSPQELTEALNTALRGSSAPEIGAHQTPPATPNPTSPTTGSN